MDMLPIQWGRQQYIVYLKDYIFSFTLWNPPMEVRGAELHRAGAEIERNEAFYKNFKNCIR